MTVCHVLSLSFRLGLVWVDRDGTTPPGVRWGFEGKVETKDCCRCFEVQVFLWAEIWWKRWFVNVCHHIMPYHAISYPVMSILVRWFRKAKVLVSLFFSSVMPPKQVARQATGQKKAAALKEDKAGLQCCDVFSKGTDTTPLFTVLLTSDLNFCGNSKRSFWRELHSRDVSKR